MRTEKVFLISLRSLVSIIKEKHETRFTSAAQFITLHSHAETKESLLSRFPRLNIDTNAQGITGHGLVRSRHV